MIREIVLVGGDGGVGKRPLEMKEAKLIRGSVELLQEESAGEWGF